MGRIIQKNNGVTTIFTSGEDISSIEKQPNTYVVGVNSNTGLYEKLNPSGIIVDLEKQNIIIPKPVIKIKPNGSGSFVPSILVSYLPYSDSELETFKQYEPRLYLFRLKSSSRKTVYLPNGDFDYKYIKPQGFYHPTHQNGINFSANTPIYGGATRIPMDTEYELNDMVPYKYTTIPFNPYQWVEFTNVLPAVWQPMDDTMWNNELSSYRFTGKNNRRRGSKSIEFKLVMGIKNPTGSNTNPILFGEFSETFRLRLQVRSGIAEKFSIDTQLSSVKRNIN